MKNLVLVMATLVLMLAAASPAIAEGTPRNASTGWALLEVGRPANSDDATWQRLIKTELEKIRQTVVTDGSPLQKELLAIIPSATVADLNDRLSRSLEVYEIPGTALIHVRLAINDDLTRVAKATAAVVDQHLKATAAAPENQRAALRVIVLPTGR